MPRRKVKKRRLNKKEMRTPVDFNESLPTKYPPQLQPFPLRDRDVEFVSLLSDENPGSHSYVFDVVVEGQYYALKMFKFYDVSEHEQSLGDKVEQDMIIAHLDSFFAECRAYGCIEEKEPKGKVAVRCRGFMAVSATQEEFLEKKFHVSDWDRPKKEYDLPASERQSFRAIVKDFIEDKVSFRTKNLKRMVKDLRTLRNMPLFVRDVRVDNYRGGKLLDFSIAWTAPHVMLDTRIRSEKHIDEDMMEELFLFDEMVAESGVPNPDFVRAVANSEFIRSRVTTENLEELSKLCLQPRRRY